ncbi:MAG: hypothetical protein NVS3B26_21220 [Mycobacteriales bacterium]
MRRLHDDRDPPEATLTTIAWPWRLWHRQCPEVPRRAGWLGRRLGDLMRRTKDRLEHLRAVPTIHAWSVKELTLVARLAEGGVPAGRALVEEGTIGREFYVPVSGQAEATRGGKAGAHLGSDASCGELALLDPQPRTASVIMVGEGEALKIMQREFWTLFTDVPALARKLLQGMARRMPSDEAENR